MCNNLFICQKLAGRTPKTPKTLARIQAPTTGHADSPETFVVGKKVSGRRPKTPKPLPRKGRKGQNVSIKFKETIQKAFTLKEYMYNSRTG